MAIEAGDFKTGLTVMVDGDPWQVIDFMHVKPGKGAAILKTKMKNLKTGSTQERNFNASTKFEAAMIEKKATLSTLTRELVVYPQLLVNVKVTDKVLAMKDEDVLEAAKEVEKTLGDDGRILLRSSGTEELVRVMVEAKTDEICKEQAYKVVDVLVKKGYKLA